MQNRFFRIWLMVISAAALLSAAVVSDSALTPADSPATQIQVGNMPLLSDSTQAAAPSTDTAGAAVITAIPAKPVADTVNPGNGRIKVVDRKLSYRAQIGAALGMMAFIVIIMTTTQSMNPD